jgi:hypothetical protein
MKKSNLVKRASALGFSLFDVEEDQNANLTLADMVKSGDLRLWEGFPVVLANSAEKGLLNFDKLYPSPLVTMSLALYKALGLKFSWVTRLYTALSTRQKKEYASLVDKFKQGKDFKLGRWSMSAQRLKTTFNNYFSQERSRLNELVSVKEELGLEYALSQVFSPKQKELFLRKLQGEKLTKTEREYFSRAVKKKVLALANPELHRLAVSMLERLG